MLRVAAEPEPAVRPRRLRRTRAVRDAVRETRVDPRDFIYPIFVRPGRGIREPIASMPGQARLTVDLLPAEAEAVTALGVAGLLLFGLPESKDPYGSGAYDEDGIVQRAVRALRAADRDLLIMADVCLCEYTSHGHCGVIRDGGVDNDATLPLLARAAVSLAAAGADVVAPSAMMDGQVAAIRAALSEAALAETAVMAYSAKYASAFYGPFREAAGSSPQFGDRRTYQMDPGNAREAEREIALDVSEGADLVMVKPALAYLDVLQRVRPHVPVPLAAYVSGEYAMVKAAAREGWLEEERAVLEILTAIKRAGVDLILTYHAKEAAAWLAQR